MEYQFGRIRPERSGENYKHQIEQFSELTTKSEKQEEEKRRNWAIRRRGEAARFWGLKL